MAAAAMEVGLSPAQGKNAIAIICREIKLAPDLAEIRARPTDYQKSARRIIDDPKHALEKDLRGRLMRGLRLKNPEDLTPKYVSNLSVSSMLSAGLTLRTIADTQAWLVAHGTRLKPLAPKEGEESQAASRAMLLLDAFGFDVKAAQDALRELHESAGT